MARQIGTVKRWNDAKGYGFISPDGGEKGKDVFCHFSNIEQAYAGKKNLEEGGRVEFDVEQTEKGPQAVRVQKL